MEALLLQLESPVPQPLEASQSLLIVEALLLHTVRSQPWVACLAVLAPYVVLKKSTALQSLIPNSEQSGLHAHASLQESLATAL